MNSILRSAIDLMSKLGNGAYKIEVCTSTESMLVEKQGPTRYFMDVENDFEHIIYSKVFETPEQIIDFIGNRDIMSVMMVFKFEDRIRTLQLS